MIYQGSSLSSIYLGSSVRGFSSGSIIVDYVLHLADNTTEEVVVNATNIEEVFVASYMEAAANGVVDIAVDTQSIIVVGKQTQ